MSKPFSVSTRPKSPSGVFSVKSTTLSINIQSALVHGESNLHCYFESVTVELRTKTFLHCWDNQAVDTDGIEPGAEIFGGMMARTCQGLPETEYQSAQFSLLLHMSVKLSHRLELSAQRQSAFNHIIGNASMDFVQMQGAVFEFFDWKRSAMPKAAPVEQASAPVYPEILPRFEDLPVKELKLPPTPPQAQPVKVKSEPKTKAAALAAQEPAVVLPEVKLPEVRLPEVRLPEFKLPELTLPKIVLPRIEPSKIERTKRKLPRFSFPSIGTLVRKAKFAAEVVRARIERAASSVANGAKAGAKSVMHKIQFGAEVVRAGFERAASSVANGAKALPSRVKSLVHKLQFGAEVVRAGIERAASAIWNGAKERIRGKGYDRV